MSNNQREERERVERENFTREIASMIQHANAEHFFGVDDAESISFWSKHGLWTYCGTCGKLMSLRLLPCFHNRPVIKPADNCPCQQMRYFTPNPNTLPDVLKGLLNSEIAALHPLTVHTGDYK